MTNHKKYGIIILHNNVCFKIIILKDDENMNKYERWVDELSKTLINNLENKLIFEKKVQVLETTVKVQKDYSTIARVITEGGDKFKLILEINEEDDERFIQFVICHELWHLLFAVIGKLIISQYSASDDSLAVTNVQRESEGKRYGEFFEEMLCDYLGLRLLWLYYAGKYTMAELKCFVYSVRSDPVYNENKYEFTKNIISHFGEVDVFDTYSKDTSYPDNILLYTIITGNLNLLINDYDECMGKGAWKRFMNHFENYILFDDESSKQFISIEMKRFKLIDELK